MSPDIWMIAVEGLKHATTCSYLVWRPNGWSCESTVSAWFS